MHTEEIWKPLKDYEEIYEGSTLGRIRSIKTKRILKTTISRRNRVYVGLYKNRKGLSKAVSRFILNTFVEMPKDKPECHHIDGDPLNNYLSNLQWVSRQENMNLCKLYNKTNPKNFKISKILRHENKQMKIDLISSTIIYYLTMIRYGGKMEKVKYYPIIESLESQLCRLNRK